MPGITRSDWDSLAIGLRAGQVDSRDGVPSPSDLAAYDYAHVHLPQAPVERVGQFEAAGFQFITLDFQLVKKPARKGASLPRGIRLEVLAKTRAPFVVEGFVVEGSRFCLDPKLRDRLRPGFWDEMIREHCARFADYVLCAVDAADRVAGIISCFEGAREVDLFLVAVHPRAQGRGIGRALVAAAESRTFKANKLVTTSVVAANIDGMNFYLAQGFRIRNASAVMHFWGRE